MSLYYLILWNQVDILQKHFKKDHVHMRLWTRFYGISPLHWQHDKVKFNIPISLWEKLMIYRACSQRSGANHVPKAVSDHDLLPAWVRDFNVCSQALQPPSRSQTGSAHCEVIFCSYCADWPMHSFSAHFQKAHSRITFQKSFAFTSLQNQAF